MVRIRPKIASSWSGFFVKLESFLAEFSSWIELVHTRLACELDKRYEFNSESPVGHSGYFFDVCAE